MIESGNKKEEYREIKKYWIGRLAKCGGHNSYEKTGFYCKKAICFSCITRGNGFHPDMILKKFFQLRLIVFNLITRSTILTPICPMGF